MRKTILFIALGIALTSQSLFAQVPSYVPTNGLVGYWPFNNSANDESGNGNNGVVNGATLTTDRNGNVNSAYSFDGVNDYIQGVSSNLPIGNSARSISAWISLPSINNDYINFISSWGYGDASQSSANKAFGFFSNLNAAIGIWQSFGASENNEQYSYNFQTNAIYHLVVTIDNNGFFKFYINSNLVYINQIVGMATVENGGVFRFGRSTHTNTDGWAGYFFGTLDDIGIWNRALTQQEITNLYSSVSSNECLTMTINTGVLSTNPVTYTSSVSIYPNPANDQITIDCGTLANVSGWSIKITNMQGQEVFNAPMNTQQYVVPLNTWSGQGMYFVKIINAQNEVVNIKKIILQ